MEDSIIQKAKKKVQKHKKTTGILSISTLIIGLQMFHILGPMICNLPFIHDTESCLESVQKAGDAAKKLGELQLDAGVLQ